MTNPEPVPPQAMQDAMAAAAAADLAWARTPGRRGGSWGAVPGPQLRRLIAAAAPHLAAAERERCAQLAEGMKFTLHRPAGNGPGAGTRALDVVLLGELLVALRQEGGGT